MNKIEQQIKKVIRISLEDVKVKLTDEFDQNFERKAFFAEKWKRKRSNDKPLLMNTGSLRRSIKSNIKDNSIVFYSDLPYAGIHNEGGTITVTRKMKGYFWIKYKEATGGFTYTRKGEQRNNKANRTLTSEAEFFRAMALKKVGSKIIIPRRQFVGTSPEVEQLVLKIIEDNLTEFFNSDEFNFNVNIK